MTLILKASLKDGIDSWLIKVNTKVAMDNNLQRNDICEVFNRDRGSSRHLKVKVDGRIKAETAVINRETAQLEGAANNDQLEITKEDTIEAKELMVRIEMEGIEREEQINIMSEISETSERRSLFSTRD
jgi:hypothetical protein